jgi:pyruvate dehydrogenase E1 component alpha subunit
VSTLDETEVAERGAPALEQADRIALFRFMALQRAVEERGLSLYKQGKVPGSFYDGRGQEATCVGATYALDAADTVCPLIRDMGAHLVRGTTPLAILAHYLGRAGGVGRGRDGNVHIGEASRGVVGMTSMLSDMLGVAVGMALAFKLRGERRCALAFFGDGATSVGDWHEAVNFAAVQDVPLVMVLENNGYAYSTPTSAQFKVDPLQRAAAYGIRGVAVDGNDVEAVFEATREARARALAGGGPTLIAAETMRMHGHGSHDDARYVPPELLEYWAARDPLDLQRRRLVELGVDVAAIEAAVTAEVAAAAQAAVAMGAPDPASATTGVYATGEPAVLGRGEAHWSGFCS